MPLPGKECNGLAEVGKEADTETPGTQGAVAGSGLGWVTGEVLLVMVGGWTDDEERLGMVDER